MTIISGTTALAAQINRGGIVATALLPGSFRPTLCNARNGGADDLFGSVSSSLQYTPLGGYAGRSPPLVLNLPQHLSPAPSTVRVSARLEADVGVTSAEALIATGLFVAGYNPNASPHPISPEVNNLP